MNQVDRGRREARSIRRLYSLMALHWITAAVLVSAEGRPPNILLILTDDQGWGDIASHGNPLIDTPTMDRLAARGARFERFYVSPVCAPTRASLLTGRYHLRTGVHGVTRGYETMRSEEVTLAEYLKTAGYATGCFGKWHNGAHMPEHPNGQGFEEFFGFCAGHWNNYFDTELERNGRPVRTSGYLTDVLTHEALEFVRKNRERPFLCYLSYNAPHSPFQVPDRCFDKYKSRGLDDTLSSVYGMVENVDENIARLLTALHDLDLESETIVVFLTDNGPNTERFNGGMKGRKGSVQEGGVRVPCFLSWPGHIQAGVSIPQIASHIDLLPTLLDLCRQPAPTQPPLDGLSLVPLLEGKVDDWPDRLIFSHQFRGDQVKPVAGSVRSQRWRAANTGSGWELYDMVSDPAQARDLAKSEAEVLDGLRQSYEEWFADVTGAGFEVVPIQIGRVDAAAVTLPGHEAFLFPENGKGIRYRGQQGWANDWITGWTGMEAYPWWDVEVTSPGRYEVSLLYACAEQDVGVTVVVEIGGRRLATKVEQPWSPRVMPTPDRVPRKEVVEQTWGTLNAGVIDLETGRTQLAIRAVEMRGAQVIDLKAVRVQTLDSAGD